MMKRLRAGAIIIVATAILSPFAAGALSIQELQGQVQSLLAQIAQLQQPQASASAASGVAIAVPSGQYRRVCNLLYRDLVRGSRGDDVAGLQEFLNEQGYLSAGATGYYGALTAQAVARWQASQSLSAVGRIGPMSRERIKNWCGGAVNAGSFQAWPTSGNVPLTVYFWNAIGGDSADGYSIDFGDGATGALTIGCGVNPNSGVAACPRAVTASHTYASEGTFTVRLTHIEYNCEQSSYPPQAGCRGPKIIGIAEIHVGTPTSSCRPLNYMPIACSDGSQAQPQHNEEGCLIGYECPVANFTPPASCKAWNDGCNICSRQSPTAPAACTLRACFAAGKGYCSVYFDNPTTGNKPPVISGISGPTTLAVNQTGTWTINASDPENMSLSYNIVWGDDGLGQGIASSMAPAASFVQTSTFTHAYAYAGTYTISVTVTDGSGQSSKTTTTVQVGGGGIVCTQEYAPVCGQLPVSNPCLSTGTCLVMSTPAQTYGNRCLMNSAGASFLYNGACTNGLSSVLSGIETIGPICPVQTYPPQPQCQPSAVTFAAHRIFVYASDGTTLINTITATPDGSFSAALNSGSYLLKVENAYNCSATDATHYHCSGIGSYSAPSIPVTVSGATTVNIDIDTGIR